MNQAVQHINHWAVLAAALATFFVGGLWYGPLFGKKWMEVIHCTQEDLKKGNQSAIFAISFILAIIQAYNLAMFTGPLSLGFTIVAGIATGAGWVSTALGIIYLFERRPIRHFLINAGYVIAAFTVMAVILGAWK